MIQFYEEDGVTPLGAEDAGEVLNGAESDTLTCVAINEGGSDVTPEFFVAAIDPTGSFDSDDLAFQGGWWQMRLIEGGDGASNQTTQWESVGRDLTLKAEVMPPGSYRTIERKLVVPADAGGSAAGSAAVVARYSNSSSPSWRSQTDSGFGGIVFSRDASNSAVLDVSGLSGSSLDVEFDHVIYRHRGEILSIPAFSDTVLTSTSSTERWVLLSVGYSGATLTDGAEAATVTEDDKPASPAGEQAIAYFKVDDTEITETDVVWTSGNEGMARPGAGLAVEVEEATVRVADRTSDFSGGQISVADDDSSYVGITRNGSLTTWVDGDDRPQNTEAVSYVTASSGSIDVALDIRARRDRIVELGGFLRGTVADDAIIAMGVWANGIGRPISNPPFAVAVASNGDTSGATSFNFEIWNGSTWDSVFETGAEPSIAHDSASLVSMFQQSATYPPNSFLLRPGDLWRWRIESIPGGTSSSDAYAAMFMELV